MCANPRKPARDGERLAEKRTLDNSSILLPLEFEEFPGDPGLIRLNLHCANLALERPQQFLRVLWQQRRKKTGALARQLAQRDLLFLGCRDREVLNILKEGLKIFQRLDLERN